MISFPLDLGDGLNLVLRDTSTIDAMHALTIANIDRLKQWEGWAHSPQTHNGTAAYTRSGLAGWTNGSQIPVVLRMHDEPIGSVGVRIDQDARTAEFGYWVDGGFEGRGAVRRAVEALLPEVFVARSIARAEIRTASQNLRSRALAERLGFRHEGTLASAFPVGSVRHDLAIYGRLPD